MGSNRRTRPGLFGVDDIADLIGMLSGGIIGISVGTQYTFSGPDAAVAMDLMACMAEFIATPEGAAQFDKYMDSTHPDLCTCGHPETHVESIQRHATKIGGQLRAMLRGDQ